MKDPSPSIPDSSLPLHSLIPLVEAWPSGRSQRSHGYASLAPQIIKLNRRLYELDVGAARANDEQIINAVGALLVALIQFGSSHDEQLGINRALSIHESYLEMCLNTAWAEIKNQPDQ